MVVLREFVFRAWLRISNTTDDNNNNDNNNYYCYYNATNNSFVGRSVELETQEFYQVQQLDSIFIPTTSK